MNPSATLFVSFAYQSADGGPWHYGNDTFMWPEPVAGLDAIRKLEEHLGRPRSLH